MSFLTSKERWQALSKGGVQITDKKVIDSPSLTCGGYHFSIIFRSLLLLPSLASFCIAVRLTALAKEAQS